MRRMFGDFEMSAAYGPPLQRVRRKKRNPSTGKDEDSFDDIPGIPDLIGPMGSGPDPVRQAGPKQDSYFNKFRNKRQTFNRNQTPLNTNNRSGQAQPRLNPGPANTETTGR